ncbi:Retrovirus-related Pol polyprotein from transposon TNT 1-94 [Abeliophyllum distichum]|uniref:Retrovirus-related Pol polyprotein from transposon TNT 1-94 n=1 Tax=Abeliophyllum distichum TaxID=126358 RepID=A0ABD1V6Y0_9LAMI
MINNNRVQVELISIDVNAINEKVYDQVEPDQNLNKTEPQVRQTDDINLGNNNDDSPLPLADYQLARDRNRRQIRPPNRLGYSVCLCLALLSMHELLDTEPKSYQEVIESEHADKWIIAMKDKIASLYKNNTWKLIPKVDNKSLIDCKSLFKVKPGSTLNELTRYKARFFLEVSFMKSSPR